MHTHGRRIAIIVHGGAGNSKNNNDGCLSAAQHGYRMLMGNGDALSAAVEAVVVLEDDPRFNAGTGSIQRTDGTIETDASVMDTRGRLGAVACLRGIRNPVRVARKVADTRHWMLAGEGALEFARSEGCEERDLRVPSMESRQSARTACDTVGAVALDREGHFAVASSTGGARPALPGRVGDTAIVGCGFYTGPDGAIAVTGIGEHIVSRMLARTVYDWIAGGLPLQQALDRAVTLTPSHVDIGIIGLTRTQAGAASNREMPHHIIEHDGKD